MTGEEILDLPMGGNDAGAETIRDYLKRLLELLWADMLNEKRPFGNSGWEYEIYRALIEGGASFAGEIVDGELEIDDEDELWNIVHDAIEAL